MHSYSNGICQVCEASVRLTWPSLILLLGSTFFSECVSSQHRSHYSQLIPSAKRFLKRNQMFANVCVSALDMTRQRCFIFLRTTPYRTSVETYLLRFPMRMRWSTSSSKHQFLSRIPSTFTVMVRICRQEFSSEILEINK